MMDQEQKLDPTGGTPTYMNQQFSITETDTTTVFIGEQQEETITVVGAGDNGEDWIGKISKTFSERCIQEMLDEYCQNLGILDDQTVTGEKTDYEDYNYARYDSVNEKWLCYKSVLTGDGTDARAEACVDNDGNTNVNCQAPNAGQDEPAAVDDPVVQVAMTELIRHHVEYGCKRADTIDFTAPDDSWVRCGAGCEPKHQYTRPSKCNLCEETGFTVEPECVRFFTEPTLEYCIRVTSSEDPDICGASIAQHWDGDDITVNLNGNPIGTLPGEFTDETVCGSADGIDIQTAEFQLINSGSNGVSLKTTILYGPYTFGKIHFFYN